jgi:hypothetical protein
VNEVIAGEVVEAIDSQDNTPSQLEPKQETALKVPTVTCGVSGRFIDRSTAPLASRARAKTYKGISIE